MKSPVNKNAFKESDLVFWSRQLSEHILFLFLGLEDCTLKNKANKLHKKWEKFRLTFPKNDCKYKGKKWQSHRN